MNKLDKKQIPQFAALCVLSAGVFGYFVVKIVTPSPAAAGTRPRPAPEVVQAGPAQAPAAVKGAGISPAPADSGADAPAPTPGMRDPFVVGYVDPSTAAQSAPPAPPAAPGRPDAPAPKPAKAAAPQVASIREVSPAAVGVPALPFGIQKLPPMGAASATPEALGLPKKAPEAPAAPAWTVTGVLQSGAGQIAILRNGEARRIVRTGDFVDGVYRVAVVTRGAVTLRHGKTFYHLTLGVAGPAAPALIRPALSVAPASGPAHKPVHAPARAPQDAALTPSGPPWKPGPAQVMEAALRMAHSYMTPAQAQVDACLASFRIHTEDAQVFLDLSRDVYADRQVGEGPARWRCALATDDLGTPDAAGNLLDRYN